MASIKEIKRKNGGVAHQIIYRIPGQTKQQTRYFSASIPASVVKAEPKRIEAEK